MSAADLVALVCCDLGGIVRGRSVLASELEAQLGAGVGWVPANQALTPLGPVAEPNPFGSIGDLRLLPDPATHVRVGPEPPEAGQPVGAGWDAGGGSQAGDGQGSGWGSRAGVPGPGAAGAFELLLCDIVETDGRPWACCPRSLLRETLARIEGELGAQVRVSFEHEFQLLDADGHPAVAPRRGEAEEPFRPDPSPPLTRSPAPLPFSLEAVRTVEPFAGELMGALIEAGVEPERFFAEYAPRQFEVPVAASDGLAAADRSVVFREVVREVARRRGLRASFSPLLDPADAGNGVHIHLTLLDGRGESLLYDPGRPGALSELGGRFAAGVLAHARALSALTAPSPVSHARLGPHRWSAGAVCLGLQNRETLLRITPVVSLAGADPAAQLHLEYRGADGAANPHLALSALLLAGLEGVRSELPPPEILDRDPATLEPGEAARFGVDGLPGSLEEALRALAEDDAVRSHLNPLLYEAYVSVKRAELEAVATWTVEERCRRYAHIY